MAGSHWAFLASPMHSRWILTSIRRCSGGITEPSANNQNSWYSWGSISRCPKFSMLALKFFANFWGCFVGKSAPRIIGDDQWLITEYSQNNHRTFAYIFNLRCIGEVSTKHRRLFADSFWFCYVLEYICYLCSSTSNVRTSIRQCWLLIGWKLLAGEVNFCEDE